MSGILVDIMTNSGIAEAGVLWADGARFAIAMMVVVAVCAVIMLSFVAVTKLTE